VKNSLILINDPPPLGAKGVSVQTPANGGTNARTSYLNSDEPWQRKLMPEAWSLLVVEPRSKHTCSIILLHGFQSSAAKYARWWIKQCRSEPGCSSALEGARLIFMQSPTRQVSCYGKPRPVYPAWHDYFTDHGGEEGRPDVEEEIDTAQLAECRVHIHRVIDEEIERLGDASRVAVGGQSQGACTALHAALTHRCELGGAFCSFGMLYSCTPLAEARRQLPIWAFHGAEDTIIASSLATRSHARLREAGFQNCCLHVAPTLEHCEPSCAEALFFLQALEDFFTAQPPTTRGTGRPSVGRLRRRPSPQKARADRDRDMRRADRDRGSTGRPLQKRQAKATAASRRLPRRRLDL
jgi:predicted esterase